MAKKIVLRSFQSPGDIVMLTAAVRDLKTAHEDDFEVNIDTACNALWENNPHLNTNLNTGMSDVESIDCHYPLIHTSNKGAYHFIHGYRIFLEEKLGVTIPAGPLKGDVHLSGEEKGWVNQVEQSSGHKKDFWIIMAGGKTDFTCKWWNPKSYQEVVNAFLGKIMFVQCGEANHWHPPLDNVINLVGKTDSRQYIRLMYHAVGVVCPVTFGMHLSAAVSPRDERPKNRACVVIAGGREPAQWEAYPHHRFLNTNGALTCCEQGGCWKSRCQTVGDGDAKDAKNMCEFPVDLNPELRIPKCMNMITSDDVIRAIQMYYDGGVLEYLT